MGKGWPSQGLHQVSRSEGASDLPHRHAAAYVESVVMEGSALSESRRP